MIVGRWPGTLGILWLLDLMLLGLLLPAGAQGQDLRIAVILWMVPTTLLALASWRWWKHH